MEITVIRQTVLDETQMRQLACYDHIVRMHEQRVPRVMVPNPQRKGREGGPYDRRAKKFIMICSTKY